MVGGEASILFVSQKIPWPRDAGGNIRAWHLLEALGRRYALTLVTSCSDGALEAQARAALAELCADVRIVPDVKSRSAPAMLRVGARSVLRGSPALVEFNRNAHLARAVGDLLARRRFDLAHLNHVDAFPYLERRRAQPFVLDSHNLLFVYYRRMAALERGPLRRRAYGREARLLERYELCAFRRARVGTVCSRQERDRLLELDPGLDIEVLPNGADCQSLAPPPRDVWENPPRVCFVGDMAYEPNDDGARWFVAEVMPHLRERVAGVRFVAVGKNPGAALCALAQTHPDVEVTGRVDDVRDEVFAARACVVPLRYGTGTRIKLLEAFAMGMPTVSTAVGAEGVEYRDGEDVLIADGPAQMAARLAEVLTQRELHDRLRRGARATALARYDWSVIGAELGRIYAAVLARS